ncbi:MAG: c(7)-type cytochrome triheme domain-containing protein [Deltaproteobacteria bacterium]
MKKISFWIFLLTCACIAVGLVAVKTGHAEYGDVVLNSKSESMKKAGVKPVVFPHWFHRIRFKCKVCHEDIFILKKGANDINMTKIMGGEFCGKCHNGLVAWEPLYCDRCHSYTGANPDAPTNQN